MNLTQITIVGNLASEPDSRTFADGRFPDSVSRVAGRIQQEISLGLTGAELRTVT
jgi:hypothetical protein